MTAGDGPRRASSAATTNVERHQETTLARAFALKARVAAGKNGRLSMVARSARLLESPDWYPQTRLRARSQFADHRFEAKAFRGVGPQPEGIASPTSFCNCKWSQAKHSAARFGSSRTISSNCWRRASSGGTLMREASSIVMQKYRRTVGVRVRRSLLQGSSVALCHRHGEDEATALAEGRVDGDLPLVRLYDSLGDEQAEAGAFL